MNSTYSNSTPPLERVALKDIEEFCKKRYNQAESVIHRYSHVLRVAQGAVWFSQYFPVAPSEEQIVYLAGLFHDIVRPITEVHCHAESSAHEASEILANNFDISQEILSEIVLIIKNHRKNDLWASKGKPWHQCVYLADKIWEHMGAYADFRASIWVGELSKNDYKDIEDPVQAILTYYTQASQKFLTGSFPKVFDSLVKYQLEFNTQFQRGLIQKEPWAQTLATSFFNFGKRHQNLDEKIKNFSPKDGQQQLWHKETLSYLSGNLRNLAQKLVTPTI
ncbi:MAG: HD domain-containing protein [Candidatus Hodarchaeota archaeon]